MQYILGMSKIGKLPVHIPDGVEVSAENGLITVIGNGCMLTVKTAKEVALRRTDNGCICVDLPDTSNLKSANSLRGLYRMLLNNFVYGISNRIEKSVEIIGVGYKASLVRSNIIDFDLGYSHRIIFIVPSEIETVIEEKKGNGILVTLRGHDKQLIGEVAAKIRALRPVEPYKGKGIRYLGERVVIKEGKKVAK